VIDWKARCRSLEQELGQMVDALSHDLRAPLRAAEGFSQVLLTRHTQALDPDAQDYLQRIRAAATTMARHIDGLSRLARASTSPARNQPVSLSGLSTAFLQQRQSSEPDRPVAVAVADGLEVMGDQRLLDKLMNSLLDNAWKFSREASAPRIEVASRVQGAETVYQVRDNGRGFDMNHARHLFEPFTRLHPEAEIEGLGLGLAIARRVVHRHGGRIWAESAPGLGATFSFTLDELVAD
jgi:light-regulated signal transduction histidine kinase (bacteriophytochrome)